VQLDLAEQAQGVEVGRDEVLERIGVLERLLLGLTAPQEQGFEEPLPLERALDRVAQVRRSRRLEQIVISAELHRLDHQGDALEALLVEERGNVRRARDGRDVGVALEPESPGQAVEEVLLVIDYEDRDRHVCLGAGHGPRTASSILVCRNRSLHSMPFG
jgi:hypothetical protein